MISEDFRKSFPFKRSCHCPHLAKIQQMKAISEPLLPTVIYTICQNLSLDDFRKKFSFSLKISASAEFTANTYKVG